MTIIQAKNCTGKCKRGSCDTTYGTCTDSGCGDIIVGSSQCQLAPQFRNIPSGAEAGYQMGVADSLEDIPVIGMLINHVNNMLNAPSDWYGAIIVFGAIGIGEYYLLKSKYAKRNKYLRYGIYATPVALGTYLITKQGEHWNNLSYSFKGGAGGGGGGYGGGGGGGGTGGYKGTPGWYTGAGHHHCNAHSAGCLCTDPGKCAGKKGTGGPYCAAHPQECLPNAPNTCCAYYPGDQKWLSSCPQGTQTSSGKCG